MRVGVFSRTAAPGQLCAIGWLVLALTPPPARAAGVVDEVWVGGFAHDIVHGGGGGESGSADFQIEVDSPQPAVLRGIGAPRLNATFSANSAGQTNFGSVGFTWDRGLTSRLRGSFDLGVALTDGVTGAHLPPGANIHDRPVLGSKALFREALGLDWRTSDRWSVGVEFVHLSNGNIFAHGHNDGVNDLGLRLGYKFR
jgi:lipid A 3-O-deacylase